ncbi:IS5 family transposase [Streptomyces sp. CS081A]|uniref:IS5 family transposase n=1 Tax=Streptomyces sp. CS081A TaxID=2162709 RepID=UPI001EF6EBCB|nr:IS5 family transposase [Streptomyces sp. CS081A]
MTRRQLTDAQWKFIEPYLPIGKYGPYPERLREQFEGMIWRFRSSGQWREMPAEFGPWATVYGRFRIWRDAGVFTALLEGLIAQAARAEQTDLSLVSVDSTTVRAHHDAAGAPRQQAPHVGPGGGCAQAGDSPAKRGGTEEQNGQDERRRIRRRHKLRLKQALLGRSRGGLTSKIHLAADRRCRPLAFVLTAGQAADSPQFIPVLEKVRVRLPVGRPRTKPGAVAGDKAYSSRGNRRYLRKRNIKAVIPEKKDQAANRKKKGSRGGRSISHDADLYKERNTVERLINKLKAWRGVATRYDKSPESYLAGLHLRASIIWIDDSLKYTV